MTVIPGTTTYTVVQGATFREALSLAAGDDETPLDLTGATIRFQIRPPNADTIELTIGNGGILFDDDHQAADGAFVVYISAEDTDAYQWSKSARFELEITSSSGDNERWLEGLVHLSRQRA